jgi:hypothetical protein
MSNSRPVCEFCSEYRSPGAMAMTYGGWICHICHSTLGVKDALLGIKQS